VAFNHACPPALQDITSLIQEAGGVLAAHDSDGDRQLDFGEFSGFMAAFMEAAGFQLQEVVADLVTLAQTKVGAHQLDYYTMLTTLVPADGGAAQHHLQQAGLQ